MAKLNTYAIYCEGYPAKQLGGPRSSVKAATKEAALRDAKKDYVAGSNVTVKLVRPVQLSPR